MVRVRPMKPLPKAPLTPEDGQIIDSRWYYRGGKINPLWYIQWDADTRDAELMLRQSWHLPGYAVIEIAHDEGLTTHVIPGRLEREKQQKFRLANPDLFAGIPDKGLL